MTCSYVHLSHRQSFSCMEGPLKSCLCNWNLRPGLGFCIGYDDDDDGVLSITTVPNHSQIFGHGITHSVQWKIYFVWTIGRDQ